MATIIPFQKKEEKTEGSYSFQKRELVIALLDYLIKHKIAPEDAYQNYKIYGVKLPTELKLGWRPRE